MEIIKLGFNPLHCGAVVASRAKRLENQLESLGFNPLHCGAVVASVDPAPVRRRRTGVSIPFIAGQWSLRRGAAARAPTRPCFNPLHCGAVVASWRRAWRTPSAPRVSIPFIAGQWSLQLVKVTADAGALVFQSPSLRGSGRFAQTSLRPEPTSSGFNPLHCGAVVASGNDREVSIIAKCFNPLHCGAVVASCVRR